MRYWFSTPRFTVAVYTVCDYIAFTAPILNWAVGKDIHTVHTYYRRRFPGRVTLEARG